MAHSFSNPWLCSSGMARDFLTAELIGQMMIGGMAGSAMQPNIPEPPPIPEMTDLEPTGEEVMGEMQKQAKKRAGMRGPGGTMLGPHTMSPGSVYQSTLLGG